MEEEINRRLDHLTRPNVFAVIVISIHVAYFLWVGMGNWTFGGGITAKALDQAGALSTDLVDRGEFWRLELSRRRLAGERQIPSRQESKGRSNCGI